MQCCSALARSMGCFPAFSSPLLCPALWVPRQLPLHTLMTGLRCVTQSQCYTQHGNAWKWNSFTEEGMAESVHALRTSGPAHVEQGQAGWQCTDRCAAISAAPHLQVPFSCRWQQAWHQMVAASCQLPVRAQEAGQLLRPQHGHKEGWHALLQGSGVPHPRRHVQQLLHCCSCARLRCRLQVPRWRAVLAGQGLQV